MARPVKCGLSYIPFDTDFFNDRKIRRLLKAFGGKGVTVYMFVILEAAKNNGYYLDWDSDYPEDIAEALGQKDKGFSSNLVSDIVSFCLKAELFDSEKFSKFGVITSKGLQTRFVAVKETVNRRQYLSEELINEDLIVQRGITVNNDVLQRETSKTIVTTPKEKKSKEKKSKEKENCVAQNDANEIPANLNVPDFLATWEEWRFYRKERRSKLTASTIESQLKKLSAIGAQEAIRVLRTSIENGWLGIFPDKNKEYNDSNGSFVERLQNIEIDMPAEGNSK